MVFRTGLSLVLRWKPARIRCISSLSWAGVRIPIQPGARQCRIAPRPCAGVIQVMPNSEVATTQLMRRPEGSSQAASAVRTDVSIAGGGAIRGSKMVLCVRYGAVNLRNVCACRARTIQPVLSVTVIGCSSEAVSRLALQRSSGARPGRPEIRRRVGHPADAMPDGGATRHRL
jgi:hypothetical protein